MLHLKKKLLRQVARTRRYRTPALHSPPGTSPGIIMPAEGLEPTLIKVLAYGPQGCKEDAVTHAGEIVPLLNSAPVIWVQITGMSNVKLIEELSRLIGIHQLVLEDIYSPNHRPKIEEYDDYLFVVAKLANMQEQFETEQLSMILRDGLVVTFQNRLGNRFDLVKERICKGSGKIRHCGADYLFYALLDALVDGYYPALDTINRKLEMLEEEIIGGADKQTINNIHHLKSDLLDMHRAVWPMRDILTILVRKDTDFITDNTVHFLRDCLDQSMQISDLCEFYRDTSSGLMNTFLAYSGYKMNEIMKVLTMISAVFIPLSFIAGVYGMNFSPQSSAYNMPELHWKYGYVFALCLMGAVAVMMLVMFWRSGWLSFIKRKD